MVVRPPRLLSAQPPSTSSPVLGGSADTPQAVQQQVQGGGEMAGTIPQAQQQVQGGGLMGGTIPQVDGSWDAACGIADDFEANLASRDGGSADDFEAAQASGNGGSSDDFEAVQASRDGGRPAAMDLRWRHVGYTCSKDLLPQVDGSADGQHQERGCRRADRKRYGKCGICHGVCVMCNVRSGKCNLVYGMCMGH